MKAEKFKIDKSQNASRQVKVEFVVSDFCVFACPFAGLGMLSCVCVCVCHTPLLGVTELFCRGLAAQFSTLANEAREMDG